MVRWRSGTHCGERPCSGQSLYPRTLVFAQCDSCQKQSKPSNCSEVVDWRPDAQKTGLEESAVFVSRFGEAEEKRYWEIQDAPSLKPFSVDCNTGDASDRVYYCLSALPKGVSPTAAAAGAALATARAKVASLTGEMHNCRACKSRMAKQLFLFGPDGYVVDLKDDSEEKLYCQIAEQREPSPVSQEAAIDEHGCFVLSEEALNRPHHQRQQGEDATTGEKFYHLGLNYETYDAAGNREYLTKPALGAKLTPQFLSNLWSGAMDGRLSEICGALAARFGSRGAESNLDTIARNLRSSDKILRKDFWAYRVEYVERVQAFAKSLLPEGTTPLTWDALSAQAKMHVRLFALCQGGAAKWQETENLLFKACSHVVDLCTETGMVESKFPGFMNERSDPAQHMVRQIAERNLEHSVQSPFTLSLSWESTSDLDGRLKVLRTNETVSFVNKETTDGESYLNFDANSGPSNASTRPVETFTLSSKTPGKYRFLVNNYATRAKDVNNKIAFTVITNLNGEIATYEDIWDCRCRKDNSRNKEHEMIRIVDVEVTQAMIDGLETKKEFGLTPKEANRLAASLPAFKEKFGESVESKIVDMVELEHGATGCVQVEVDGQQLSFGPAGRGKAQQKGSAAALDGLAALAAKTKEKQKEGAAGVKSSDGSKEEGKEDAAKKTKSLDSIAGLLSINLDGGEVALAVHPRNFPPSTLTAHSCGVNLKTNVIVSSYLYEGTPPVQPTLSREAEQTARFEQPWLRGGSGNGGFCAGALPVTAVLPISVPGVCEGWFLSLQGMQLPPTENGSRSGVVLGAGMYPQDLRPEFHALRDVWQALHTAVCPVEAEGTRKPGIGVFLHKGKKYRLSVQGKDREVEA